VAVVGVVSHSSSGLLTRGDEAIVAFSSPHVTHDHMIIWPICFPLRPSVFPGVEVPNLHWHSTGFTQGRHITQRSISTSVHDLSALTASPYSLSPFSSSPGLSIACLHSHSFDHESAPGPFPMLSDIAAPPPPPWPSGGLMIHPFSSPVVPPLFAFASSSPLTFFSTQRTPLLSLISFL
jgi:hypothetical protein